jgi:transposase
VAKLCKILPISAVAELLELDIKTVKEIDKRYLAKKFSIPDYSCLKILAIDELSYRSGHRYLTIVLDIVRTRVIWVEEGRGPWMSFSLRLEGQEQKRSWQLQLTCGIPTWPVSLSMLRRPRWYLISSLSIAEYSRMLDRVRNEEYRAASNSGKKVIKGSRYLLLKNEEDLVNSQKERLKRAPLHK